MINKSIIVQGVSLLKLCLAVATNVALQGKTLVYASKSAINCEGGAFQLRNVYWDGLCSKELSVYTDPNQQRGHETETKATEATWAMKTQKQNPDVLTPNPILLPLRLTKLQPTSFLRQWRVVVVQILVLNSFTLRIHPDAAVHSLSFHPPNSSTCTPPCLRKGLCQSFPSFPQFKKNSE